MTADVSRASWNSTFEKGLVDIMLDLKNIAKYKGHNGWFSEGWRVITSKFNEKFPVANYTKQQIQEKEKELKANYKAVRDAKKESGNGWNESMCMILVEPLIWEKLIKNHPKVAKFKKKPFPLFYQLEALYEGSVATGDLNFTSVAPILAPAPVEPTAPAAPMPPGPTATTFAPAASTFAFASERSNSGQSIGTNPFASSFDGQETSSARNEPMEAQSAPPSEDSRKGEGGGGRKHKQSHIGSALEDYVEYKKNQTSKTLEALNEKKRREEQCSIGKCVDQVDKIEELTDEDKSYALELFESETNREIFMNAKNTNVRLLWLKRKIRMLSGVNA